MESSCYDLNHSHRKAFARHILIRHFITVHSSSINRRYGYNGVSLTLAEHAIRYLEFKLPDVIIDKLARTIDDPSRAIDCIPMVRSALISIGIPLIDLLYSNPHVITCKFWRWPDLQSPVEIMTCSSVCRTINNGHTVCINPYHYEWIGELGSSCVIVPPELESAQLAAPPPRDYHIYPYHPMMPVDMRKGVFPLTSNPATQYLRLKAEQLERSEMNSSPARSTGSLKRKRSSLEDMEDASEDTNTSDSNTSQHSSPDCSSSEFLSTFTTEHRPVLIEIDYPIELRQSRKRSRCSDVE